MIKRIALIIAATLLLVLLIRSNRGPNSNSAQRNFRSDLAVWQSINLADTERSVTTNMGRPYCIRTLPLRSGEVQMIDKSVSPNTSTVKKYYLYYFKQSFLSEYLPIIGFDENGRAIATGMLDEDALHDHHEHLK